MRDQSLENRSVLTHWIRRQLRRPVQGTPGVPAGGSLWERIAGVVQLVQTGLNGVALDDLLHLNAGCELETIQTTAAPLTGDVNDYNPGPGYFIDLHPTADRTITGLAGGASLAGGRWHVLHNNEQWTLTFPNESLSSAAGNRFFCFTANAKVVLYGGESAIVVHEPGLGGRWLIWKIAGETHPKPFTLGDLHYVNSAPELARLVGNITTTRKFLRQTGTGAVSAAPDWDTIVAGDIPNDAVTFARMQNIATARILGRATAGSGDVEELTGIQVADIAGYRTVLLSSDFTRSATSLADVTGMGFSVVAGGAYDFGFFVTFNTAATTTGINLTVNGPTSPFNIAFTRRIQQAAGFLEDAQTAYDAGAATPDVAAAFTKYVAVIHGTFTNGANAGTLILRAASEVALSQVALLGSCCTGWIRKVN